RGRRWTVSRFQGRVAIVTGSSSGIGLAIARRLASEGASVVLVSAPQDSGDLEQALASLRESGARAEGIAADIAEPDTGERAVELALSSFARLDVLVNNAGIAYFEEVLPSVVEHLDRTLAVNVRGTFLCSQAAARVMAERGGGAIVNTAS